MAPADRRGYQLLPTDDITNAGGPVVVRTGRGSAQDGERDNQGRASDGPRNDGRASAVSGGSRRRGADAEPQGRPRSEIRRARDSLASQNTIESLFPGTTDEKETKERKDKLSGGNSASSYSSNKPPEPKKHVKYEGGVRFDLSADPWTIHPWTRWVQVWNASLTALLAFDVAYIPVEVAFGQQMPHKPVWMFNMISSVLFSLDILLQFFLQIQAPSGDYWVFNHMKIIKAYLKGWFLIDVISVFPFSEVQAFVTHSKRNYMFHLLRFSKLLRMTRILRLLNRYHYSMGFTTVMRAVILSVSTILISLHVMSCMWSTLGNYQNGYDWLTDLKATKTIHTEGENTFYNSLGTNNEDPFVAYIASTYFALYTLTGIGYGDITPTTQAEYLASIMMMLGGSLIWATIIGNIVNVMRSFNVGHINFAETIDSLMAMSKEYDIDPDLKTRIQNYLEQSRVTMHTNFVQEQVISRMTSMLAVACVHSLHEAWMHKIWWLQPIMDMPCIVAITVAFSPMLFCPKEFIRTGDKMFVIQRGLAVHGRRIFGRNEVWGVDVLLSQHHLRVSLTTVAMSYLHVLYVTREDLYKALEHFPAERAEVRRAYVKLSLIRGIVYKANQIKARQKKLEAEAATLGVDLRNQPDYLPPGSEIVEQTPAASGPGAHALEILDHEAGPSTEPRSPERRRSVGGAAGILPSTIASHLPAMPAMPVAVPTMPVHIPSVLPLPAVLKRGSSAASRRGSTGADMQQAVKVKLRKMEAEIEGRLERVEKQVDATVAVLDVLLRNRTRRGRAAPESLDASVRPAMNRLGSTLA